MTPNYVLIAVSSIVLGLYIYFEIGYSNSFNTVEESLRNIRKVDLKSGNSLPSDSFVYSVIKNATYNEIYDSYFNFEVRAAVLSRSVEYCQWVETSSTSGNRRERHYTYHIEWKSHQVNSFYFHNSYYHTNPKISDIPKNIQYSSIDVSKYVINETIFDEDLATKLYLPNPHDLFYFMSSSASERFKYIGGGWFYSEYAPNYYISQEMAHMKYGELSPNGIKKVFRECEPGDIRVQIKYFAPEVLSVVGYSTGQSIKSKEINGVKIGAADQGEKRPKDVLLRNIRKSRIYCFVLRIILIVILIIQTWNDTTMFLIAQLVTSTSLVLFFRSLLWNKFIIPVYASTFLLVLILYYDYSHFFIEFRIKFSRIFM